MPYVIILCTFLSYWIGQKSPHFSQWPSEPGFSKCNLQASSIYITRELVEIQNFRFPPTYRMRINIVIRSSHLFVYSLKLSFCYKQVFCMIPTKSPSYSNPTTNAQAFLIFTHLLNVLARYHPIFLLHFWMLWVPWVPLPFLKQALPIKGSAQASFSSSFLLSNTCLLCKLLFFLIGSRIKKKII